jgi:hypothetical protein
MIAAEDRIPLVALVLMITTEDTSAVLQPAANVLSDAASVY